jgi:hypothetical protein
METRRMAAERLNGIPVAAVVGPLVAVLNTVASRKLMSGAEAEAWVEAVRSKLEDIGVESIEDFVRGIILLNRDLMRSGNRQLHATTVDMMLEEAMAMVEWPAEG